MLGDEKSPGNATFFRFSFFVFLLLFFFFLNWIDQAGELL